MKLKLDENLGERGASMFRNAGHDVATVYEEGLCSASDYALISACRKEGRCLVTLDLDYCNHLRFKPERYSGIAVLRLPKKATDEDLWKVCRTLIAGLQQADITQKLWIVQAQRIREYRPEWRE